MLDTTETLLQTDFGGRVIKDSDIATVFGGTPARRYGLVNKALLAKELIHLRRGAYIIAPKYNPKGINEYYIANQMVPYSFITAETALSYHRWIPERVVLFISMVPFGRNKEFTTSIGQFAYRVVKTIHNKEFLKGVRGIVMDGKTILMAMPLRALLDYVFWSREKYIDFAFLQGSLRIEPDDLLTITPEQIEEVKSVYPQQRMQKFLINLKKELFMSEMIDKK